jgi:uncharacterized membrane protein
MAWAVLVVISFFIPNSFFIIWANYFAMAGSVLFILYGLILLIDAAHSWAEMCLERYEATESRAWELVLVGSTFGMYTGALAMVVISYIFFAQSGCGLNQTFVSVNLVLAVLCTGMAIHPTIQEANSRSGLAQSAMVCIYATYLTLSAVCNGQHSKFPSCVGADEQNRIIRNVIRCQRPVDRGLRWSFLGHCSRSLLLRIVRQGLLPRGVLLAHNLDKSSWVMLSRVRTIVLSPLNPRNDGECALKRSERPSKLGNHSPPLQQSPSSIRANGLG